MDNRANSFPPFYVGQKVVCVKSHRMLLTDRVYVVAAISKSPCCDHWCVDVGVAGTSSMASCALCGGSYNKDFNVWWFYADRFCPLEQTKFPLMTFEKIKETEKEEILILN